MVSHAFRWTLSSERMPWRGFERRRTEEQNKLAWAAAPGPEAERVDKGKAILPVKVLMEPTLQEAQSPHVPLVVIWGNNVHHLFAHPPPPQPPEQSHGPHRKKKHKSEGLSFPTSLPLGHH